MYDVLYGRLRLSSISRRLLATPEILRLREVRLSNVDTWSTPGFANVSRYEHLCGVAHLAERFIKSTDLSTTERVELLVSAVYHDVATPAFGHLVESIFPNFNHEREVRALLGLEESIHNWEGKPIYGGMAVKLRALCRELAQLTGVRLERVVDYIVGRGRLGCLLNGPLDLDNLDNVTRAAYYCGVGDGRRFPPVIAQGLRLSDDGLKIIPQVADLVCEWIELRNSLYKHFCTSLEDVAREATLKYALQLAYERGLFTSANWYLTDSGLIHTLLASGDHEVMTWLRRYQTGRTLTLLYRGFTHLNLGETRPNISDISQKLLAKFGVEIFAFIKKLFILTPAALFGTTYHLLAPPKPHKIHANPAHQQWLYLFALDDRPVKKILVDEAPVPVLDPETKKRKLFRLKELRSAMATYLDKEFGYAPV